jgi:hypothetical protein
MKKATAYGIVLATAGVCAAALSLELGLRIIHGKLTDFAPLTPEARTRRVRYDSRLGWVPRSGRTTTQWTATVDASGLRSNGGSIPTANRPVLAIGDSFTFGDEVDDDETWPARLEGLLNERVLNGGVSAYGIDQAFLRAELLLEKYDPQVVILAFISADIDRTEFSYCSWGRGAKPYFTYANGSLTLCNVPVPPDLLQRRFQTLRRVVSYSFLANAVLSRAASHWWFDIPIVERAHGDGEDVCVELLAALDSRAKSRKSRFLAVALGTNAQMGSNDRLLRIVERMHERGIQVLDLSTETLKLESRQQSSLFRENGHYSPAMNQWVASQVATLLRKRWILPAPRDTE